MNRAHQIHLCCFVFILCGWCTHTYTVREAIMFPHGWSTASESYFFPNKTKPRNGGTNNKSRGSNIPTVNCSIGSFNNCSSPFCPSPASPTNIPSFYSVVHPSTFRTTEFWSISHDDCFEDCLCALVITPSLWNNCID